MHLVIIFTCLCKSDTNSLTFFLKFTYLTILPLHFFANLLKIILGLVFFPFEFFFVIFAFFCECCKILNGVVDSTTDVNSNLVDRLFCVMSLFNLIQFNKLSLLDLQLFQKLCESIFSGSSWIWITHGKITFLVFSWNLWRFNLLFDLIRHIIDRFSSDRVVLFKHLGLKF